MLPLPSTSTNTHTHVHTHTDTHLGPKPLFQHSVLHDVLFPKNYSCVPFYPKLSHLILSSPALLSRQGSFMEAVAEFTP